MKFCVYNNELYWTVCDQTSFDDFNIKAVSGSEM